MLAVAQRIDFSCFKHNVLICPVSTQFIVLAKIAKAQPRPAAKAVVASGPAMSAKEAAMIVSMRKAVDQRLNNLGHTCLDGECGGN
mmetsp:Transcript_44278/g.104174  ORF Transcript_44278/g.104174 Transcript_44278/m.104174 type:complete len:86 (-) Transcript_44278:60-317(-)